MSKKLIHAVILVRVSDNEKETLRQIRELRKVARQRGWKVVEVCQEPISPGPEAEERAQGVARVRELVEKGNVTQVMVDDVSRIGRRNSLVLGFLQFLEQHNASLYWHSQEIETRQANGKRNQKAAIVVALLEEMARAEREAIVERTKTGLAAARARGRVGGRPKGLSPEAKRNAAKAPLSTAKELTPLPRSVRSFRSVEAPSSGIFIVKASSLKWARSMSRIPDNGKSEKSGKLNNLSFYDRFMIMFREY